MTNSSGINKFIQVLGLLGFGFLAFNGLFAWFTGNPVIASPYQQNANDPSVPQFINYQGYLQDGDGNDLDGTYDILIKVYGNPEGSGTPLFAEKFNTTVAQGYFSVLLGDGEDVPELNGVMSSAIFANPNRYVGVTVDNFPELRPLQRFTSVSYAFFATNATNSQNALKLNGLASSQFQRKLPSNSIRYYRFKLPHQTGFNGNWNFQTGISTSDYYCGVLGFSTSNGDFNETGAQNVRAITYRRNGKWDIQVAWPTENNKHEDWIVDIICTHSDIAVLEGWDHGSRKRTTAVWNEHYFPNTRNTSTESESLESQNEGETK